MGEHKAGSLGVRGSSPLSSTKLLSGHREHVRLVSASDSRARAACVAALVFAALVVALPAGRAPLWDPNEARYMLLARDILEHGRWLVPDPRGEPYLNKPQLFFWSVGGGA